MTSIDLGTPSLILAMLACASTIARAQQPAGSWLDRPKPMSWNKPGGSISRAPRVEANTDPRCTDQARPPVLDEDKRVREQGWDLVGAYQGGWQVLVIRGTAGYDGMCRPQQYQDFVFVRGVFAGTLSPQAMQSRTDGALTQVSIQSDSRLLAEYARYSTTDPLCCPSRTTTVVFGLSNDQRVVQPISTITSKR